MRDHLQEMAYKAACHNKLASFQAFAECSYVANAWKSGYEKFPVCRFKRWRRSVLNLIRRGPYNELTWCVGMFLSNPAEADDQPWIRRIEKAVFRLKDFSLKTRDPEGYVVYRVMELLKEDMFAMTSGRQYDPWVVALGEFLNAFNNGQMRKAARAYWDLLATAPEKIKKLEIPKEGLNPTRLQPLPNVL
ncbi:hypothetical protein KKI23_02385 [Patescibacteria group bacterium]|nr:hypothetical protein [Patescibacteria group bacterium]